MHGPKVILRQALLLLPPLSGTKVIISVILLALLEVVPYCSSPHPPTDLKSSTEKCRFMDKRVRDILRFFVAPRREFAPALWRVSRTLLSRNTSTSVQVYEPNQPQRPNQFPEIFTLRKFILNIGFLISSSLVFLLANAINVQSGYIGCNTGNGEKLISSQAQLGQATCLAIA